MLTEETPKTPGSEIRARTFADLVEVECQIGEAEELHDLEKRRDAMLALLGPAEAPEGEGVRGMTKRAGRPRGPETTRGVEKKGRRSLFVDIDAALMDDVVRICNERSGAPWYLTRRQLVEGALRRELDAMRKGT